MTYTLDDPRSQKAIDQLVESLSIENGEIETYIRQILVTAGKLTEDEVSGLDLKILTNAMKEIRYAFSVFSQHQERKKISVFGSARTHPDNPNYRAAESFSSQAAEQGYMLISGAGPGIMEAVNRGAGSERSFGLNISIPMEQSANRYIQGDEKCINFRYFFSRKLIFAKESAAVVFFPGGFGTHDELFELLCLLQTGRHHLSPLILIDQDGFWDQLIDYLNQTLLRAGTIAESDRQLFTYVKEPEEALRIIQQFYSNYHSSRFLGDEYLIRFRELPSDQALKELEEEFLHLCPESGFQLEKGRLDAEEPDAPEDLYRLVFYFSNHDYGELLRLVEWLNEWTETPPSEPDSSP